MAIDRGNVLQSAQIFASRGQFEAAINEWKKLSTESPGDGSIFNSIGDLHLKRQATHDAVGAFLQAANAFRAAGATLKAIATYKKVLKFDPSRYEVLRHLGDLNAERGLLSSAVQDYLTLGTHYLKAGKTREALDIYKKVVSKDPSNLDAQKRVAELCLQENMQDEATKVYLQLGREQSAQQRYAEAKDAYQGVLRIDPSNSEALQFIEHFKKTGGSSSPIAKPSTGSSGCPPKNAEPLNLLSEASRRIAEKQFAGAEAILDQMLTKEPGNLDVCQLLAKLHLQRGDLQLAIGEYRYLAGAALRAQHFEQAESLIVEFLTVEPDAVPILELYGELYEEKGDAANAVIHYGKAIELLLEHPEPGLPRLHEELFEKITELAPDSLTVKKLKPLMHSPTVEEPPVQSQSHTAVPLTAAILSCPSETDTQSTAQPAQDDSVKGTVEVFQLQDKQVSHVEPNPAPVQPEPPQPVEPEPAMLDSGFSCLNTEPDESRMALSQAAGSGVFLSTGEQFKVTAQPDHAETRELFDSLTEAKGDTEWAARFSPQPQECVPAVESPVSAPPWNEMDSKTHFTLGVAYKDMGLLDEAKEEFSLSMRSAGFFSDSCLMLAVCLKEQGECQSASAQLELLLQDPKCQGAKAQAIRYELGLLYEVQEQWNEAVIIYESIPTFHDVPQRLESIRARHTPVEPTSAVRFAN